MRLVQSISVRPGPMCMVCFGMFMQAVQQVIYRWCGVPVLAQSEEKRSAFFSCLLPLQLHPPFLGLSFRRLLAMALLVINFWRLHNL